MEKKEKKTVLYKKSVARLLVCQSLCNFYDENNSETDITVIAKNINDYFIKDKFTNEKTNRNEFINVYKSSFVVNLLNYIIENKEKLNNTIKQFLNQQETIETIDPMVLEILKTAIAEAETHSDIDKTIIINEYVDITAEFFDNVYVTFVNGILNSIFYGKDSNKKSENSIKQDNKNTVEKGKKHTIIKLKK